MDYRCLVAFLLILLTAAACSDGDSPPTDSGSDVITVDSTTGDAATDSARDSAPADSGTDASTMSCSDYTPPEPMATTCTSDDVCESANVCYPPGTGCCPVGMIAPRACENDTDCADGEVCEEYIPTTACTSGIGSECLLDCRMGGRDCTDGTCDEAGHCVPLACPDDWTCDENHDCDSTAAGADLHGCVRRACGTATECDCGACVNGRCVSGPGTCGGVCACAAPDTPIATPEGERSIAELRVGDLVYSVNDGAIVAVPLLLVGDRVAPPGHRVVRVTLSSGAAFEMSPGHPTADGRTLADVTAGDTLGELEVISAEEIPYGDDLTYDILPASSSGTYFAAGALVGSTLR
jgi:hypothetical protein